MKITQVRLWKNTGYSEGSLVVPSATSTLGSADWRYQVDYRPATSDLFKRIKLEKDLLDALEWTYIEVTMETDSGNTQVFYGWVDSIEPLTDSTDKPLVAVNWHVDLWRTYLSKADFGYGVVTRRAADGTEPHQAMTPRYWYPKNTIDVLGYDSNPRLHWVFITYAGTVSSTGESGTFKGVVTTCFPVVTNSTYKVYNSLDYPFPSWDDVVNGRMDERMKIDPESVIGAFISPIAPSTVTRTTSGTHLQVALKNWADTVTSTSTDDGYGYFVSAGPSSYGNFVSTVSAITNDRRSCVITDFDGAPVATLPWGLQVAYCSYRLVDCVTTMYVGMRFRRAGDDAIQSPSLGLEVNIPLKTLAISSNAYSSYVYSGQAQYDRETLAINRQASLDSGLANTANAAVQGAVAGGVMGSAVPGVGTLAGAGIGAVTGAVGNLATTGIEYLVSGKKNDAMLSATLNATANQTSGLLLPSVGMDWVRNGRDIKLVDMVWDAYSSGLYDREYGMSGYEVYEPVDDLASTIKAMTVGPLQVKNLVVRGPIPNTAREYIAERFSDGVIFA